MCTQSPVSFSSFDGDSQFTREVELNVRINTLRNDECFISSKIKKNGSQFFTCWLTLSLRIKIICNMIAVDQATSYSKFNTYLYLYMYYWHMCDVRTAMFRASQHIAYTLIKLRRYIYCIVYYAVNTFFVRCVFFCYFLFFFSFEKYLLLHNNCVSFHGVSLWLFLFLFLRRFLFGTGRLINRQKNV